MTGGDVEATASVSVVPSADRDWHTGVAATTALGRSASGSRRSPDRADVHVNVHVAFPVDVILINSSARTPSEHYGASNPEPNR